MTTSIVFALRWPKASPLPTLPPACCTVARQCKCYGSDSGLQFSSGSDGSRGIPGYLVGNSQPGISIAEVGYQVEFLMVLNQIAMTENMQASIRMPTKSLFVSGPMGPKAAFGRESPPGIPLARVGYQVKVFRVLSSIPKLENM